MTKTQQELFNKINKGDWDQKIAIALGDLISSHFDKKPTAKLADILEDSLGISDQNILTAAQAVMDQAKNDPKYQGKTEHQIWKDLLEAKPNWFVSFLAWLGLSWAQNRIKDQKLNKIGPLHQEVADQKVADQKVADQQQSWIAQTVRQLMDQAKNDTIINARQSLQKQKAKAIEEAAEQKAALEQQRAKAADQLLVKITEDQSTKSLDNLFTKVVQKGLIKGLTAERQIGDISTHYVDNTFNTLLQQFVRTNLPQAISNEEFSKHLVKKFDHYIPPKEVFESQNGSANKVAIVLKQSKQGKDKRNAYTHVMKQYNPNAQNASFYAIADLAAAKIGGLLTKHLGTEQVKYRLLAQEGQNKGKIIVDNSRMVSKEIKVSDESLAPTNDSELNIDGCVFINDILRIRNIDSKLVRQHITHVFASVLLGNHDTHFGNILLNQNTDLVPIDLNIDLSEQKNFELVKFGEYNHQFFSLYNGIATASSFEECQKYLHAYITNIVPQIAQHNFEKLLCEKQALEAPYNNTVADIPQDIQDKIDAKNVEMQYLRKEKQNPSEENLKKYNESLAQFTEKDYLEIKAAYSTALEAFRQNYHAVKKDIQGFMTNLQNTVEGVTATQLGFFKNFTNCTKKDWESYAQPVQDIAEIFTQRLDRIIELSTVAVAEEAAKESSFTQMLENQAPGKGYQI